MNDNGATTLTVDAQGAVYFGDVRTVLRFEDGKIYHPVKHPGDRARLKCKRVGVPASEFAKLKSAGAGAPRRPAGRMPRERVGKIVTRRNKEGTGK